MRPILAECSASISELKKTPSALIAVFFKVVDCEIVVYVLAIGKREKNEIYNKLKNRQ